MNKGVIKTVSISLAFCFIVMALSLLLTQLITLKNTDNEISVSAQATSYSTFSDGYNKGSFTASSNSLVDVTLPDNVRNGVVKSYITAFKNAQNTQSNVQIFEQINNMGNIEDYVQINDIVYGSLQYDDERQLVSNLLNYNTVYYEYDEGQIYSFINNDVLYYYTFENGKLSTITVDDELYAKFTYNNFGKLVEERYYKLGKIYEHTNIATIEKTFDPETETIIVAKIYDYINNEPYSITKKLISNGEKTYDLITKIECGTEFAEFEYNHFYNNTAYITKVTTNSGSYELTYLNGKLLTKTAGNRKTTFIYSATNQLVGMAVGKLEGEEYFEIFVTIVTDPFGNVVEANYISAKETTEAIEINVNPIYEKDFDCYGHNNYKNIYPTAVDTNIGFKGGLTFENINVVYLNGNLYSPIAGIFLQNQNDQELAHREIVEQQTTRQDPTFDAVEKSIAIESLQNEILLQLETSSIASIPLYTNAFTTGIVDVFTLPVDIDQENILKYPSKAFFVADLNNRAEVEYYEKLLKNFNVDNANFALLDEYYLTSLSDKNLELQFIYNKTLYTLKYMQNGLYGYTQTQNYKPSNFVKDTNISNYDSGRYEQYYVSTLNKEDYVEEMSFITNFTESDLNSFFDNLGMISTSMGQTYQDVNFGDNAEFLKSIMQNSCTLNLPEYNPETQYLTIDDNGNYVVKEIPADAGVEFVPDYEMIKSGILKIINAITIIISAAIMIAAAVVTCGAFAIVCGIIAIGAGLVVGFCGVAQIRKGATGESWFIDEVLNGNIQLLETISSIASTVATVALIAGSVSMTFSSCFVAGTQVATINGVKNIEDIKVGDYVLAYNEETGQNEYSKVIETYTNKTDQLCEITYNGKTIQSTLNHPYYINGKWVEAQNVKVGDNLTLSDGTTAKVESVKIIDCEETIVYNMNVEETHTYYAEGALVHNACAKINVPDGDELANYTQNNIRNSPEFKNAVKTVTDKYKGTNRGWGTVKKNIWKEYGENLRISGKSHNISNFSQVLKGKAPIIDGQRIELHHVFSKAKDLFNVVPMTPEKHTLFHKIYGYHYNAPKIPWITE